VSNLAYSNALTFSYSSSNTHLGLMYSKDAPLSSLLYNASTDLGGGSAYLNSNGYFSGNICYRKSNGV
jgi:hypothetical protein